MPTPSLLRALAENQQDRAPYYKAIEQLHQGHYVFFDAHLRAWVVAGYEECKSLLMSGPLGKPSMVLSNNSTAAEKSVRSQAEAIFASQFIYRDASRDRDQARSYWASVVRLANANRTRDAGDGANKSLDECIRMRECDLYTDLLVPFVSREVCKMLGVTEDERVEILPLINDYVDMLDGKVFGSEHLTQRLRSLVSLHQYFMERVVHKRLQLPDSHFCDFDWIANFILVLAAGHESTAFLLGTLLEQSEQFGGVSNMLQEYEKHVDLIEEALRFDSPVQLVAREALEDFTVGAAAIVKGKAVFLHIGAANRDKRAFDLADQFLPNRVGPSSLAFGLGGARCIGAALAVRNALSMLSILMERGASLNIRRDQIRMSCGLMGREFYRIPGKVACHGGSR